MFLSVEGWMNALATACSALTMFLHLPQLYKTYQTRDVAAFDRRTIVLRILNSMCWSAYGILASSIPVTASGVVSWLCEALLLLMTYVYVPELDNQV